VAVFALMALSMAVQDQADRVTSFAMAHTEYGAFSWNIGRLKRIEGRNAFNIARMHHFTDLDAAAGRPYPFVVESIDIDCDTRRYTSNFRVFFEPRENDDHPERLYVAGSQDDVRTEDIQTGTPEYSVYQSACLREQVTGYHIVEMTTAQAMVELIRFSQDDPIGPDVSPGAVADPAPPAD
jgi:hypothetical protein